MLRIREFYPGSRILTLIHPGSRIQQQQQNRGKKFDVLPFSFFVALNFTKLKIILFLDRYRRKIELLGPEKGIQLKSYS